MRNPLLRSPLLIPLTLLTLLECHAWITPHTQQSSWSFRNTVKLQSSTTCIASSKCDDDGITVDSFQKMLQTMINGTEITTLTSIDGMEESVPQSILRTRLPNLSLNRTRIAESNVVNADRGLFATQNCQEGDILTCYPGDAVLISDTVNQLDDEEDTTVIWGNHVQQSNRLSEERIFCGGTDGTEPLTGYILNVGDAQDILGLPSLDTDLAYAGHFANDGARLVHGNDAAAYVIKSNDAANAMHMDLEECHMITVATRDIKEGEEILVTYGPDYWMGLSDFAEADLFDDDDVPSPPSTSNGRGFG